MKLIKVIEKNPAYLLAEVDFRGNRQIVRAWMNGKIEFRFNDEFARANGYGSLTEMIIKGSMSSTLADMGGVPEWIELKGDKFVLTAKPLMN